MIVSRACRSRIRLGCLCAVAALVPAAVCAPSAIAASAAGGSAFGELTKGGKQESTATTPKPTAPKESTTSTATSNSNSSSVLLLGLIASGALIAGIAFMILRDARRVAPVPDGQVTAEGRPARDVAAMMRKRRAKAKAARRQRKRNR
ncbi:MAG TPA: hypothetical protein VNY27_01990 [Solirubrobacteraceae bacterium]|jgi:hypothetical protein|nr:hypothetical protein [Solirubrobacteraceae bacterium]